MIKKAVSFITSMIILAIVAVFVFGPGYLEKGKNVVIDHDAYSISDKARALHESLTVADLHGDTLLWHRDILDHGNRGHVDLPRLVKGGVALQEFSTVTKSPKSLNYEENTGDSDDITAPQCYSGGRYVRGPR